MDKISSLKKLFYLILFSLLLYSAYWIYVSIKFKNEIEYFINKQEISIDQIYVTGFPYRLESHIKNLSLERDQEDYLYLTIPRLKISISPFSFNKIFFQSNSSSLKFKNIAQELDIFNNQSRLSIVIENELIKRSIFMFEENEIAYKNIFFDYNKKLNNIILDGKINFINNKLNGNLQLDIYDNNGEKKFAAPISIENNILKLLFFELDLDNLF
jgi:hypothetical protein